MHILTPIGVFILFMFVMVLNKSLRDETAVARADFLKRITLRKVFRVLAIVIVAIMLIEIVPLDLAILYAGDLLAYFEVFTVVSLLVAQGRARAAWHLVRRLVEAFLPALTKLCVVGARKCASHYLYAIRAQRRKRLAAMSKKSDEDADPFRRGVPA
jgi:hypothetical protein